MNIKINNMFIIFGRIVKVENYNQSFIKNMWEVPGRPSDCPEAIVGSSGEKYLSTNFYYPRTKHFSIICWGGVGVEWRELRCPKSQTISRHQLRLIDTFAINHKVDGDLVCIIGTVSGTSPEAPERC